MKEEIWRPIEGYEGLYEVSNLERVRSLDRFVKNRFSERKIKGHIFEGTINNRGYKKVRLSGKDYLVHILVAQAFPEICGEWFEGCSVHHKNFNKLDNRPENLIVLTHSEHSKLHYQYQPETFTKPSEKRSKSISKALTGRRAYYKHKPIVQLTKEGELVREWECITDVKKELGYSAGNICMCCKRQLKTAYGFLWQYAVNN